MKKLYITGAVFVVFFIIINNAMNKNIEDNGIVTTIQEKQTQVSAPKYEYEILSHTKDTGSEDVSVLIKVDEPDPQGLATKVLDDCDNKAKCNVTLYDDKQAYELDEEYTQMLSSYNYTVEDRTTWKEENTVFLADHMIATVGYSYGEYSEYPLRDSYYEELKNQD